MKAICHLRRTSRVMRKICWNKKERTKSLMKDMKIITKKGMIKDIKNSIRITTNKIIKMKGSNMNNMQLRKENKIMRITKTSFRTNGTLIMKFLSLRIRIQRRL